MLLLLAAGALNLANVALWFVRAPAPQQPERHYSYIGHDYPTHVPLVPPDSVPTVPVVLEDTVHFQPLGVGSDAQYLALAAAPSLGYVRLGPANRTFGFALFHELHCVRMLNLAFSRPDVVVPGHARHCLNYLRQGVLCAPDLALEPGGDFEARDLDVERTYGTHECGDWDVYFRAVEENYAVWSEGTGFAFTPFPVHEHVGRAYG
ncbi:hypothetical protein BD413DRAFT_611454 [Trametes elegans]|nr:hypothetical protein BD413DRAFT_611454 [Trametes elegans]